MPEQKLFPSPVTRTTRISGSSLTSSVAALMSSGHSGPIAFKTRGSFSRISPMAPRLSTRILAVALPSFSPACFKARTSFEFVGG